MFTFISFALAADQGGGSGSVTAGAGLDASAGITFPAAGQTANQGGVPQLEGDLGFETGGFGGRVDLDLSVVLVDGKLVPITLLPEQAWVRVTGGDAYLGAGVFISPWRRESVDPWDRALTSVSMLSLHAVPTQLAGGSLGWAGDTGGISATAGVDLGRGVDLLAPASTWAPDAPLVVGVEGHFGKPNFQVGGGGYYRPALKTGGLELDARFDASVIVVEGQGVIGLAAPSGVTLAAEVLPHFMVSPTARLEWYGQTPGGALGVAVRPLPFIRLAAEGTYSDGLPGVWIAADIFTPQTSRRAGKGGDLGG